MFAVKTFMFMKPGLHLFIVFNEGNPVAFEILVQPSHMLPYSYGVVCFLMYTQIFHTI